MYTLTHIIPEQDKTILGFNDMIMTIDTKDKEIMELIKEQVPVYKTKSNEYIYGNILQITINENKITAKYQYKKNKH